ncbi:hypothetical protein FMM05_19340 [Flavobacterium zepuense]|uniref:Uncharacterized protein n=1 Tax=Flavobacterium zepuense TaxID=2593302 RepID=A0A552UUS8_9FLAO|nr:hypothetical protein [Flavobacterium zepuense]TRW21945.1 hypothetical protein FMM05_19340 [Flavobacterium zepuense]
MAQELFTPDGMAAKVAELYALNQTQLNAQANLIQSSFKDWVDDNFTLTTDQAAYLSGLNGTFLTELTNATSDSVRKRHSIKLSTSGDGTVGSKFFRFIKCLKGAYSTGGVNEVIGELEFTIAYQ